MKLLVSCVLITVCLNARAALILYDTSWIAADAEGSGTVSGALRGEGVTLGDSYTLSTLSVWFSDGIINGSLDHFGGTLSVAIYDDSGDNGLPGVDPLSVEELTPSLTDSGHDYSGDIWEAEMDLSGPVLEAGTYWVVLHEGAWLSPYDGSGINWVMHSGPDKYVYASDPTDPSYSNGSTYDYAMKLGAVPEPGTLGIGLALLGVAGLVRRCRRRPGTSNRSPIPS